MHDAPRRYGVTFPQWMREVDRAISAVIPGMSHDDFADACYWDNWDAGTPPADMAAEVIAGDDMLGGLF